MCPNGLSLKPTVFTSGYKRYGPDTKELVLDVLLMAIRLRNPELEVVVHSDQRSQYKTMIAIFLEIRGLKGSMSRRGNCRDKAVA